MPVQCFSNKLSSYSPSEQQKAAAVNSVSPPTLFTLTTQDHHMLGEHSLTLFPFTATKSSHTLRTTHSFIHSPAPSAKPPGALAAASASSFACSLEICNRFNELFEKKARIVDGQLRRFQTKGGKKQIKKIILCAHLSFSRFFAAAIFAFL